MNFYNSTSAQISKHPLITIFTLALILRLVFSFYFQQFYFGEFVFKYRDTPGYLNPILNLINHGIYIGDFYLEDSKYFRVPVYPTFLGFVYLIFGANYFDYAVALIQSVLDSFSAILVYLILYKITNSNRIALISGLVYATYPFIILWSPISYTEVLQVFFIFLLMYMVLKNHEDKKYTFIQGALVGILILTKQYLGLFLLIPVFMIFFSSSIKKNIIKKLILISMVFIGMGSVLSPWVIRNYVESGKVIVMKGESTGLRARGIDYEAFEKFANLFNENITPMMNDIAYRGTATFDKHLEFVSTHKDGIDAIVKKAHDCGPSFMEIRMPTGKVSPHVGCEQEVVHGFNTLTKSFWNEIPFWNAMETRVDAVKKVFMKSDILYSKIKFSKAQLMKISLFKYRVFLIILGIIGVLLIIMDYVKSTNRTFVVAVAITACAFYAFFALMIVHVEMRYILVPDLLLTIFASVPIVILIDKMINNKNTLN
ncbi:MAG: glycosyltransferase family 39 protein [Campylobacterota bacterium]|nr:glycosyltransferase family 39 protein [Campylobacterota bacterium]